MDNIRDDDHSAISSTHEGPHITDSIPYIDESATSSSPAVPDIPDGMRYVHRASVSSSPPGLCITGDMPVVHRSTISSYAQRRDSIDDLLQVRRLSITSSPPRLGTTNDMPDVHRSATSSIPSRPDTANEMPDVDRSTTSSSPRRPDGMDEVPEVHRSSLPPSIGRSGSNTQVKTPYLPFRDRLARLRTVDEGDQPSKPRIVGERDRFLRPRIVNERNRLSGVRIAGGDRLSGERIADGDRALLARAERLHEYANIRRRNGSRVQEVTSQQDMPRNRDLLGRIWDCWQSSKVRRWIHLVSGTSLTIGGIAGTAHAFNHYNSPWGWAAIWFSTGAAGLYVTCKSLTTVCLDDDGIPDGYYNVMEASARNTRPDFLAYDNEGQSSESLPSFDAESCQPNSTPSLRSGAANSAPLDTTTSVPSFHDPVIETLDSHGSPASSMAARWAASSDSLTEQQKFKGKDKTSGRRFRSISESGIHNMTYGGVLVQFELEELPPYSPEEWEEKSRLESEKTRLPSLEENDSTSD